MTPGKPHEPRRGGTRHGRAAAVVGIAGLLLFGYLSLFRHALVDDAFITLRYVKTLSESGTWGFYPHHVTNTATSPLNVVLLSIINVLSRSEIDAALWLTLGTLVLLAVALGGLSKALRLPSFGVLAFTALVFNPLLMSTLGLESILFTTLFVVAWCCFVMERWKTMAVACGLLTLTRPEGSLLLLVVLPFLPSWTVVGRVVLAHVLSITPWCLFAWFHLGSLLPDTFFLKVGAGWDTLMFRDGPWLYAGSYPLPAALALAFSPLALLAILQPVRALGPSVKIVGAFGAIHAVAYSRLHVPPHHWYYGPEVSVIILLGALAASTLYHRAGSVQAARWARAVMVVALLTPPSGMALLMARQGWVLTEAPIHTNWASPEQYRTVAGWLSRHHPGATIRLWGEVGSVAYYCDCYLLDRFGDRSWMTRRVAHERRRGGLASLLYRANFLFYRPPAAYPPRTHRLHMRMTPPRASESPLMSWTISSQWVRAGFITFSLE